MRRVTHPTELRRSASAQSRRPSASRKSGFSERPLAVDDLALVTPVSAVIYGAAGQRGSGAAGQRGSGRRRRCSAATRCRFMRRDTKGSRTTAESEGGAAADSITRKPAPSIMHCVIRLMAAVCGVTSPLPLAHGQSGPPPPPPRPLDGDRGRFTVIDFIIGIELLDDNLSRRQLRILGIVPCSQHQHWTPVGRVKVEYGDGVYET